jgi:hypothetical protein
MQPTDGRSTAELIMEARETFQRARQVVDELNRVREEVRETVDYFKWWRFLDYDPHTLQFLEKLDTHH